MCEVVRHVMVTARLHLMLISRFYLLGLNMEKLKCLDLIISKN